MKPVPRLLTLCLLASFFWAPLSAQVSGVDYVITRTQLDTAGHKLRRTVNSGGIIETTDYAGNAVYDGFSLAMLQIPGGYVTLSGTTPTYHYYQKDYLGSNRLVTRATGTVEQIVHYYPSLSPYTYCANSPANIVDPNGMDWYINNENGYYTWFDGNEDKEGYTYFGGKGSLLGEAEYIIDYLNTNYGSNTSIFSSGFTFCIRSNDVRSISGGENGFGLLEEFINNSGPEFSVFLEGHPFTKEMMKTAFSITAEIGGYLMYFLHRLKQNNS